MGIYVVGMHRSGTSAVAGLLSSLCGLPAGRLAVASNPAGQWERPELRPALELLLAWNRSTWANPPGESVELAAPAPLLAYAERVFARHCSGPFLWKDPRLCLTIDRWLAIAQDEPTVVFVHRRPEEVARSLADRNGWAVERGLALWERTNRNAVVRLGPRPVVVVDHATVLADPLGTATRLSRWLGQRGPEATTEAAAAARAAATIGGIARPRSASRVGAGDRAVPTDAQVALAERLGRDLGPTTLDLDDLGPESPTTAELLGPPTTVDLARRAGRAFLAIPRRHDLEVAGPASAP